MAKKFDKQAWQEEQSQKLEAAQAALEEGLRGLVTSDDWKLMLERIACLGPFSISRYSFSNILLLMMQRPGVGHVGTFRAWKSVGRSVRKGEKALMILAPRLKPVTKEAKEAVEGPGWDAHERATRRSSVIGFRALSVFAVEQTDGPELPPTTLPSLDAPEAFENSLEVLRRVAMEIPGQPVSGITLRPRRGMDFPGAAGWYEPRTKRIVVITEESSRAEQFSTLCHEIAHAILHGAEDHHSSAEREVEAESVAFVVCHALGLQTGGQSFPYVATWAKGDDAISMVAKSGERILKASRVILDALAPAMNDAGGEEEIAA